MLDAGAGVRGQVRSSFVGVWARQLWRSAADYLWRSCVRLLIAFRNTAVRTLCSREQGALLNVIMTAGLIVRLERWLKQKYFRFVVKSTCHSISVCTVCCCTLAGKCPSSILSA